MNSCRCPYCGKRISYFTALSIRRRGEYYCKKCKKESNVHIKKTIWVLFFAALVFALIILGYYLLITDRENPWFVFFVAVPFLLFYLFSPLFVRLRPKKKFQDSLYDTDMVNTPMIDPDPTMASSAKTAPAFIDDLAYSDRKYQPAIDPDVFKAIKGERKAIEEVDGGTRPFDKFENISSSGDDIGDTKLVGDLRNVPPRR
ncbi:hypothetical protein [uncultured Ruminococcus sp.]|uniref:hypothetical protein n=1 Tax=uncultured Ruminococcus sp. TaxID=165186 RepID=UPI0029316B0E|nr:hypothetical protein [uncultured Ruminococcus sp.]